jgi:hypothetical protein
MKTDSTATIEIDRGRYDRLIDAAWYAVNHYGSAAAVGLLPGDLAGDDRYPLSESEARRYLVAEVTEHMREGVGEDGATEATPDASEGSGVRSAHPPTGARHRRV